MADHPDDDIWANRDFPVLRGSKPLAAPLLTWSFAP